MLNKLNKIRGRNKLIYDHLSGGDKLTTRQVQDSNLDDLDDINDLINDVFEKEKEINNLRSAAFSWKKIAQSNLDENLQTLFHLNKADKYIRDLEDYNKELRRLLEEKLSQEELKFVYDFANFDFDRA